MKRAAVAAFAAALLAGCVSVRLAGTDARHVNLVLADERPSMARRDAPAVSALLIQAVPSDPIASARSIAYARANGVREFYQLASWTEPPRHAIARLLQRRLEARGTAQAVGLLGEPIAAEWLLAIGVDAVYHDVSAQPGTARLALRAELIDRRARTLAARRSFDAVVPVERADSAAAAAALGRAVADIFDALVPWLEDQLMRAAAR
ncbi:MAG: ABC-type transport auxiliary lipoprotein family protein [Pseudomonadota bacterium]